MASVSYSQSDLNAPMHVLSLVDLSAPLSRYHIDASAVISGGAARASALLQFIHHKPVNAAYQVLSSSRPDHTSTSTAVKALKSASKTCHIGQFLPFHESSSLKDMHSRLKRLWRGDEKLEGGEGELKQRNLLLQLDNHLEQKLSWFTEAQKSQSPSWVVCFGTLPGDLGTLKAPSDLKQADTARLALQKSMESSRSSLIWIECNPDRYAALVSARSSAAGGQKQHASISDPSIDLTSSKYHEFFRDLNGNGKLSTSRPVLNGFPSTRRVTMLTLDELVGDDTNPMFLIDLILSRPISNSSAMVEILQEGLKSALCDCWPEPGDDFDRVLSRTRACDKDLWGSPACGEDGPLASSQAPSLATNGDAAKMSQKENLGPLSSIPLSVAAALPKLKVPAPPRGPRGPGLLKAAKDQDQVNPSASLGTKPKGNTSRMPPPTAIGRKQLSDRIPKAPVPPRPAPRPVRQLDTKADALAALQAAEHIRSDYMRAVQLELEKLPPLGDDKRSWQPNWDVLMTVAEKAVKPAVKVLLTCSTFTVKAALKATRALRPKRKILTKNEDQVKDKEVKEPFSQEDQSINAPAAAADKAMQAEVKRVKKKGGAAVKLVEGLGENAALLPGDEADMNSLASKKLIWTLLEERWFKHSSEEIYRAHHSSHGSWNGQKMRYVNLAYVPYLMLCCLSHLDVRLEGEQTVKDASYGLKNILDELSFVADSIGGIKVVFEQFIAPKFSIRLPALMERMHLLLNGATLSDHTPDNRLSGNTSDGGSSDESDANDEEVERRSSKGGMSSRGMNVSSEARGPGSASASMQGIPGRGGSQRGFLSQPGSAADNSIGSAKPPSQLLPSFFPASSQLPPRPSSQKLGTLNEEAESAPKMVGGKLAPHEHKHFRSHMPGASKWRPTIAMDKKATNLPAALPPSQQQPVLLSGAAAKVSTAAPLPPPKADGITKPGAKHVVPKRAKESSIPGGASPEMVLGATPFLKKREEGETGGAGAGLIMDHQAPDNDNQRQQHLFGDGGNNGLAPPPPPPDYGGGTWLAPAGRKKATDRSDHQMAAHKSRMQQPKPSASALATQGPSMLEMLLKKTEAAPPPPSSSQMALATKPDVEKTDQEARAEDVAPLTRQDQDQVKEGACADANDGEGEDDEWSLNEAADACSPCKNSGRSGPSHEGSKVKHIIPTKSFGILGPASSTAATGDRARSMRREKLLKASGKVSKPAAASHAVIAIGSKLSHQVPTLKPSSTLKDRLAPTSGGSKIPLPVAASLPSSLARVIGSGGGGNSGIPSLKPCSLDVAALETVAEEAVVETRPAEERKSLMAVLDEAADLAPTAPAPVQDANGVVEASPPQPLDIAVPTIFLPNSATPLPISYPHISPAPRSSQRLRQKAVNNQGNLQQSVQPVPPFPPALPSSLPHQSALRCGSKATPASDPSPLPPPPATTPAAVGDVATAQEAAHPSSRKESGKRRRRASGAQEVAFGLNLAKTIDDLNGEGQPRKRSRSNRFSLQQEMPAPPSVVEEPALAPAPVEGEPVQASQEKRKRGGGGGRKGKGKAMSIAVAEGPTLPIVPEDAEVIEEPEAEIVKVRGGRKATKIDFPVVAEAPEPPTSTRRMTRRQASAGISQELSERAGVQQEPDSVCKRGRGGNARQLQMREVELVPAAVAAQQPVALIRPKRGRGAAAVEDDKPLVQLQEADEVPAAGMNVVEPTRKSTRKRGSRLGWATDGLKY